MIRAVIFDCFGVLVGDGLELVCQKLATENPGGRKFVGEMIRMSNSGLIYPAESNQKIAEFLGITVADWHSMVGTGEVRDQRACDLVLSLRKTYKTALLSNIDKGSLARHFNTRELEAMFDVVITSGELGMIKPNLEIYRHTADKLGVETEACVFLDDREHYCLAARNVGMQAILFQNYDQAKADLDVILAAGSIPA